MITLNILLGELYMIIYNEKDDILKNLSIFFMKNIVGKDLTSYFKINVSDNLFEDAIKFDKKLVLKSDGNYAGLTILPCKSKEKIQILISENACTHDVILHELTHMYDFVLFSLYFCKSKLHKVKKHKYHQTFIYWSEFHAKQIEIPYTQLLSDVYNNIPQEELLLNFKNKISSFYFQGYNEKFLNKKTPNIHDIMWYLGELFVCNFYDTNTTYTIPQKIIDAYGTEITDLYDLLLKCSTFESYICHVEEFYDYFY